MLSSIKVTGTEVGGRNLDRSAHLNMGGWDQNGSYGDWPGERRLDPVGSG
jgi:hypothetical protein